MNKSIFSVSIIGAGIGGLALAVLLKEQGLEVQVYEQAEAFARVGAGIQMAPNAMKVLRALGLESELKTLGFCSPRALSRVWDSAALSSELPLGAAVEKQYGAPYLFLHRADLHTAIASRVPSGVIQMRHKLQAMELLSKGVALSFANGRRVVADCVVGADGVHSWVREWMLGAQPAQFTGKVAYRTTFPASLLPADQVPKERTKWWGPDRHVVVYPVTAKRDEIYFVTSQPEEAHWLTAESWSAKGDIEALKKSFVGFHPDLQAILHAAPQVHKWALFERAPLSQWSRGAVTLLGDACHPMPPYMAQGAACALEDAMVLSRCLQNASVQTLEANLMRYEATRKPRTTQIQTQSSRNTWLKGETDPTWVYAYDALSTPLVSR